ncbi:hypothetical protein [Pseudomonas serbica]|uniref:hypothetical protein n=1 Tax=Pseudomonas serbica TaxID=2965074 RepID=UPI00237B4CB2|nr:hypothetical protein [Pseudomonas serbica]
MSKTMVVYGLEADTLCGRGFSLTEYDLETGKNYNTLELFTSRKAADKDLKDEIKSGHLEVGDFEVSELILHADGSLFDDVGREVVSHLASQNNQTEAEVKTCLRDFYEAEQARLQRKPEASSEGPSF